MATDLSARLGSLEAKGLRGEAPIARECARVAAPNSGRNNWCRVLRPRKIFEKREKSLV
jgi:hypothetical protein